MFLVNSRLGLVTAASRLGEAPLLPKLRGHLAEFLRESCLAPLGILYLPTCVGFGYRCHLLFQASGLVLSLILSLKRSREREQSTGQDRTGEAGAKELFSGAWRWLCGNRA